MRISDWSSDVCSSDLGSPPPVAVLPNGKSHLIALDLGAEGDPIKALESVVELVGSGRLEDHVIERQLHSLDSGDESRPVLGMRSEERRGGKECVRTCRSGWSAEIKKKKQKKRE